MGAIERITIELPEEAVKRLRARVAAGEFASESEAIAEALHGLDGDFEGSSGFQTWLRGPLVQAYDAVSDGTAILHSSEEARRRLGVDR